MKKLQRAEQQLAAAQQQLRAHAELFGKAEMGRKIKLLQDHPVCLKNLRSLAKAGWCKQQPGKAAAAAADEGSTDVFHET